MTEHSRRFSVLPFGADHSNALGGPTGGATRRSVLGLLGSAGLVAAAGLPVLGLSGPAHAQAPKRGGSVRIAGPTASTTDTLDPAKGSSATDYARQYMFFNGLTTLDINLNPVMTLAESFESDDALKWVVKLRSGISFHDGSSLTADDVVYSLSRHKKPDVGSKVLALAKQMETIVASGPLEVTIILSSPNADLPVMLGVSHFLIVKNNTTDFAKPVGTGPFVCQSFQPGLSAVGVRNPSYWKSGQPYLDRIELIGINDNPARVNALLSGDVDMIGNVPASVASQVTGASGYEIMETKGGNYTDIVMRIGEAPGNNPDFVLGVKHMLNRAIIKRAVYRDYAVIGNDNPIHPSNPFFNADLPQRPYDPEKAKFHITKSGMAGSTFDVTVSPASPNSEEIAQIWQQAAAGAGLKLNLRRVPADGYWSNEWMKRPLTFGSTNARPTADLALTLYFKSDSAWNESGWKNEKFDGLLLAARAERDFAKRKGMYGDLQEMITNECSIGIPVFRSVLDGYSSKIKGLQPVPLGNMMGYTFPENIWLDA